MNARTALTLIAAAATATGSFAQGPTLPPGLAPPSPPSATQQGNSATAAPKDACSNCATITTIQMTTERQDWTPLGTVAPGSVGIAGAGVSEGRTAYVIGSDLSNKGLVMLGAAGGAAYAKRPNSYEKPRWDVTLKMDVGGTRIVSQSYEPLFREGDRVRVFGTQLELINP
jgi:hypothetical protein